MRLFKTFEASNTAMERSEQRQPQKAKRDKLRAPKPQLSASEIRDKVQEHFKPKPSEDRVDVSKMAKAKKEESEATKESSEEVALSKPSDVGLNNPNDPATVGKLRDVLSKGAFNFNPREREALEKILADRD